MKKTDLKFFLTNYFLTFVVRLLRNVRLKNTILTTFLLTMLALGCYAQNSERIVQLSGLVIGGDSLYGIPYVSVYVPKAGRGTMTNDIGYFSLPTIAGDSVVVSAIGFKKKSLIIPSDGKESLSLVIELMLDTTLLPTVEVFPYYTEEMFKRAFLALQLPSDDYNNMKQNLHDRFMSRLYIDEGMGPGANYRYYMQQQAIRQDNRFKDPVASSQLFNPFAWYSAINSLRQQHKDKKKKRPMDDDE